MKPSDAEGGRGRGGLGSPVVSSEQVFPSSEPDGDGAVELSGIDRRHLRRLGHGLEAVVQIGASGVTRGVVAATNRALADHELVKLRIAHEREERREIAEALARDTASALAGMVGRTALLYRPAADPAERRIALPSARRSAG